ncbi:2Fe-2S iron-sulfur cluster-binding protein [Pigmentibacter sp. JX0631]|uniref:2Fe-2S iron-sulfur cluster-binding protein n=1 Tax=Pigmentibacter sp. JX0631 TaxID=2976982 RepID=UPI0024686429|nr:2Fe-2S iron-sulfur cluster-binding protein [Pigmentibacter sp. JX0631]WGL60554.1 2Fe-2S iron-sulfur cluster-binding protein [Pigmentibacter sp. JX0631]
MSETVTLTIDGKEISVPKGTSVIEATELLGIEVPRFCWHPGLSVAGVCRFCMVKIEGMPKLQIACNTTCTEGMKVTTTSDDVKDAHKWALEFHLINHPLDCPICDQAGECELQNYYMKVGKYTSQMDEDKVLKPKALDVGDNLVLDTERCILCSRCVRFEDEVTKTSSLGIFNRGDHSVIGTFPIRKIQHNYSYNIVDICPVGAFTAKDFRFKCRVWFLSETKTICPGCSTGCNVTLYQNKNQRQYYRLKPRKNKDVNGHWMCDYGRTMYDHLNAEERLAVPLAGGKSLAWTDVNKKLTEKLLPYKGKSEKVALVLTPQYTNEEYQVIFETLKNVIGAQFKTYVWRDPNEKLNDFDGILFRGDKNPNTAGLKQILENQSINAVSLGDSFAPLAEQHAEVIFVFGPEIEKSYTQFANEMNRFTELQNVIYFGSSKNPATKKFSLVIPTKVFAEKNGTFVNYNGVNQKLKANPPVFPAMLGIEDIFSAIKI